MGPLSDELLRENSKKNMLRIQDEVKQNAALLEELIELFCHAPYRIQQRAAWVVGNLPEVLIKPYLNQIMDACANSPANDAVKRNTMRLLQFSDIPEDVAGTAWNLSFYLAEKRDEAIAIRAFAIGVLANLAGNFPELKGELIALLEQEMPYTQKGLLKRMSNTLKSLQS